MCFTPLLEALQNGSTVITPTNRLQRELLWRYTEYSDTKVVPHPQCFSYESWLELNYENYRFNNPEVAIEGVIDDWQLHLLWKTSAEQELGRTLHYSECQQALSALKNCALSLVSPQGSDFLYTPMAQHFNAIWNRVMRFLKKKSLCPQHLIANRLISQSFIPPHSKLIWACFDTFHPLQQSLIEHMKAHEIQQFYFDMHYPILFKEHTDTLKTLCTPPDNHKLYYLQAMDGDHELEQIILWLKHQRIVGAKRLGLVVPDLSLQKSKLYRQLSMHFPEQDLHFSLGESLSEFPIIKHALVLLKLSPSARLSRQQCRILLSSPFITGHSSEKEARQRIRVHHPLLKESEIPYQDFIKILESSCPILAQILNTVEEYPKHAQTHHLSLRLNTFGFPGGISIPSTQQAILQKFYHLLEASQSLHIIKEKLNVTELLEEINGRLNNTVHQPPQNYDGIHIMGWLESSGFKGDAVWICHFTSQLVPQPISYSSLLPIRWQKYHQLPRTNPDKETAIATQILYRLMHSHTETVISMAEQIEQQVQWPSPLLPKKYIDYIPISTEQNQAIQLELITETFKVPLTENTTLKGSSYLLSVHAQCPFQAFASYRLHLAEPHKEEFGLNPLQRGQLLHQCLYQLWETLKSQQALLALEPKSLDKLITDIIQQSLNTLAAIKPYSLDNFLIKLEIDYLKQLLTQALELDKQRPSFKIYGLEQDIELKIDEWPFQLRYDRIDELEDGTKCLIDYKSSLPSPLPWNQEQALYPQILMYALADATIQALLFMVIKFQDTQLTGISATDTQINGVKISKEDWSNHQQKWLIYIRELIISIRSGLCVPRPAQANTCQKCIYQDLCRT